MAQSTANPQELQESPSIEELLKRFWSFHDNSIILLNPSDQFCEDQYALSTRRDDSGRYFVRLSFKSDPSRLGRSLETATRRFFNLERKLSRQPSVKQQYYDFIHEYEQLGHLEVLKSFDSDQPHYFLPHHCVLTPTSFDASCKTSNGISLNDVLHPGP